MEKTIYEQFDEMIEYASALPNGWSKIEAFEEIVQFAEEQNEYELAFYGRLYLSDVSYSFGVFEKFIPSFFWCLHVFDQNQGLFDPYDLLWQYKWILDCFDKSPSVSTDEIHSVFEDMRQRYNHQTKSLRPYYQNLSAYYGRLGDKNEEEKYFHLYEQAESDDMSDCQVCELHFEMTYFLSKQEYEEAFQRAKLILFGGHTCNEIPHRTYATWLLPLLEQGDEKEARRFHERGYFLIRDNPLFLFELSQHLFFLSLTNLKQALKLFERHLELAEESYNFHDKFHFFLSSWFMLEQAEKQRIHTSYSKEAFQQMTIEIASLFDQRNGNKTYGEYIQKRLAYRKKR